MLDTAKIKAVRERRKLTIAEASRRAGFESRQAWHNIESGRHTSITLATLAKIAAVLELRPKDLLK